MSYLVVELFLILLLAMVIGWFLGRYLCKSGEYKELDRSRRLGNDLASTQTELQQRTHALANARNQLNQVGQHAAELTQQKEGLTAQLSSLKQERDKLLQQLQELEVCNTRLKALTEEFNLKHRQLQQLSATNNTQVNQIEALQTKLQHTSVQLADHKRINHVQQATLEQTKDKNDHQARIISRLEEDSQELQRVRQQLKTDRTRIETLEEDNKKLHAHMDAFQFEHQQLKGLCKQLSVEVKEKDKLELDVERLKLEKQDFLGRLRAIASVVDVISNHDNNNPQPLLIGEWHDDNS